MASVGTGGVEPCFRLESAARPIGHINLWVKLAGKPSARNWHAGFDEAGAGNVLIILSGAPVLDPTREAGSEGSPIQTCGATNRNRI